MKNIPKKNLVVVKGFLLLSVLIFSSASLGSGVSACFSHYNKTNLEIIKLDITQRFDEYVNKNKNSSPVFVLDQFLDKELENILSKYNNQMELLKSTGVDSKLKSRLKIFDANLSTAEILSKNLLELYEAKLSASAKSQGKSFLGFLKKSSQSVDEKISKALEEFKSCKSKFDKCTLELQQAIQETSTNLVVIEKLIQELALFSGELKELDQYVSKQNDYSFFQILMNQKIDSIAMMTQLTITNSQTEKTNMVTALMKVKTEVPEFREKIDLLIAKGAPEELSHKDDKIIKSESLQGSSHALIDELFKIGNHFNQYLFIKSLAEINYSLGKFVFTAENSIEILDRGNFINNSFPNQLVSLKDPSETTKVEFKTNISPFFALDILRITTPSKDAKANSQFLSLIYRLTSRNLEFSSVIAEALMAEYPHNSTEWINWRSTQTEAIYAKFKSDMAHAIKPFLE